MTRWLLLLGLVSLPAPAVGVASSPVTEIHYTMGTYFSVTVAGMPPGPARTAMRECFAEARRLESIFSRYDPDSELSRLNARGASPTDRISHDMADLLRRALALRSATGGAFDVTIGALTALWRDSVDWPTPDLLRAATGTTERVRMQGSELVRLQPGVQLDFDGIAKGYAVDQCVRLLRAAGVQRALVSLGESSQYALGAPAGLRGWEIAVRGPAPDTVIGRVRLHDQALSVSSAFGGERNVAGRHVGHIIDPQSTMPLDVSAIGLVAADHATDAEAYSKATLIWAARRDDLTANLAEAVAVRSAVYVTDGKILAWHPEAIGFRVSQPRPVLVDEEPLR